MGTIIVPQRFSQRYDTVANWAAKNPVLWAGEIAFESDTGRSKRGDGATAWNSLPYQLDGRMDFTGIANGDVPVWDSTSGRWVPGTSAGGSGAAIALKGRKPTYADLPSSGNATGDAYIVDLDGLVYIYDGGWPANGYGQPIGPDFGISVPALFVHSEIGVWFDGSDISTLYKDTAGTTPVTAVGDAVQRINDKSGNGINATGACTYQQDASGRKYLAFNGTSNYLTFGTLGAGQQRSVHAVVGVTTPAAAIVLESSTNVNTNTGAWNIGAADGSTSAQFSVTQRTVSTYNVAIYDIYSTGVSCLQAQMDRTLAPQQYQRFLYRDGTERQIASTPFAAAVPDAFYNGAHYINSRAGTSVFGTTKIYELVIVNRVLTPTERAALARMLMRKYRI